MMRTRTIVAKFGGTSLADAAQFKKIKAIIEEDPDRRFIVASAPGKRFDRDVKVTDLLMDGYESAIRGEDTDFRLLQIKNRFDEIITGLDLAFPLEEEISIIRQKLAEKPEKDYVLSRGEYLNSRILAADLGFTFVDPAWCVCFDEQGRLEAAMTNRALGAALHPLKNAVIAGFYGADMQGKIHTFSRGGSDVTG
ncbi:MAG: aspartate kinase, partial [Lachnospiraceae bacterium]|nr:aspartate kinase [Lachnospiraceae bacterium]